MKTRNSWMLLKWLYCRVKQKSRLRCPCTSKTALCTFQDQLLFLVQFAMELFDFLSLAFYFPHLRLKIFVMLTVEGGGEVFGGERHGEGRLVVDVPEERQHRLIVVQLACFLSVSLPKGCRTYRRKGSSLPLVEMRTSFGTVRKLIRMSGA